MGAGILVDISIKVGSCEYYYEWKFGILFPIVTDGFITAQRVQGNQDITGAAVVVSFYANAMAQPL